MKQNSYTQHPIYKTTPILDTLKFTSKLFDDWCVHTDRLSGNNLNDNYPPYNIIKTVNEESFPTYVIEMAVAGLCKEDLKIVKKDDKLSSSFYEVVISNNKTQLDNTDSNVYLHKGIANRSFVRKFYINKQYDIASVNLINGLLRIVCVCNDSNATEERLIEINSNEGEK